MSDLIEPIPGHDSESTPSGIDHTRQQQGNAVQDTLQRMKAELHKVIVGMDSAIDECLAAVFIDGHVLFEGYPGVAKTLLVKLIARTINIDFRRIQFTPDLMPSDVIGTNVFDQQKGTFHFHRGPIFSNLVLIDEINRSPAKTQSALFEAMEERQVTVEGQRHELHFPFLVIATQNPIDQEGTYRLPEAQLDRFTFRVRVPFPSAEQELAILTRFQNDFSQQVIEQVKPVTNSSDLQECRRFIEKVHIDPNILHYITQITMATREHEATYLGASPRASMAIMKASKAFAAMAGRNYVTPDDVQKAAIPVLNHRLIIGASAEMEGFSSDDVIRSILENIEVPR